MIVTVAEPMDRDEFAARLHSYGNVERNIAQHESRKVVANFAEDDEIQRRARASHANICAVYLYVCETLATSASVYHRGWGDVGRNHPFAAAREFGRQFP